MTRKEVIDMFRSIDRYFCTTKETHDAIKIVIEALKEREKDGDLIRRQDVINEIVTWTVEVLRSSNADLSTELIGRIKALPSAQKTGKWIIFPPCFEEICMCSNCKTKFKEAYQHRDTCPSCGARMVEEE